MATRMLIDARHPEETRVAVLKGNRIEEFDFESAERKQIKGNIYLAKVTRVEPSLQAAFVDFGGNRHGFLAFSEIHPDYYQIPQQDREALLAEELAHAEEEAALRAEEEDEDGAAPDRESDYDEDGEDAGRGAYGDDEDDEAGPGVEEVDTGGADDLSTIEDGSEDDRAEDADEDADEGEDDGADPDSAEAGNGRGRRGPRRQGKSAARPRQGSRAKEMDALRAKRQALRRRYKIQDVIQRRQVLLVQVVKEERGNKGAALTTYLSLAGRYCVLMPNSGHGGGISRKISSAADRKRLKQIVADLSLPRSMGLIVRTAGLQRTKPEIKRDFDYLARLWDEIRETTLASSAPALIHSDSDLIKRAIRDIYDKEIEEVVVEGEDGFRAARQFMKLLMPSHVRRVKAYSDPVPLFQRYGAEDQLSAMYDPVVQLKSGGYIVINPTEALVSIDINSGRSIKEHGIEATAVNTNLEAAREIARQLRLRDMAGLVVIDFIDMEYSSNIRKVEKAMKEALKNDRARIQIGRISGFGLMEMSRQRLRTGVLEATTRACPHCDGTGLVRTASSAGLSALRLIEDEAAKGRGTLITLYASTEAAVYLLNAKRADLAEIEHRYGVHVEVIPEGEDEGAKMRVTSAGPRPTIAPRFEPIADDILDEDLPEDEEDEEEAFEAEQEQEDRGPRRPSEGEGGDGRKKRRRRRGGRNRAREDGEEDAPLSDEDEDANQEPSGEEDASDRPAEFAGEAEDGAEVPRKRRRRGGRRRRRQDDTGSAGGESEDGEQPLAGDDGDAGPDVSGDDAPEQDRPMIDGPAAEIAEPAPARTDSAAGPAPEDTAEAIAEAAAETGEEKPRRRARRRKTEAPDGAEGEAMTEPEGVAPEAPEAAEKPKRTPRRRKAASDAEAAPADTPPPAEAEPAPPRRTRARKAAAATPEPAAEAEPEAEPQADTVAPEPVEDAQRDAVAASATADEDGEQAGQRSAEGAEGDGSPRRGWWQRTFG